MNDNSSICRTNARPFVSPGRIALRGGAYFSLARPDPQSVCFASIVASLSKPGRFTGHCSCFYSVAQHFLLVADYVSSAAYPDALLHDAHEALTGDWSRPFKQALYDTRLDACISLQVMEASIADVIHRAAGLAWPVPPVTVHELKRADLCALLTERDQLHLDFGPRWPAEDRTKPYDTLLQPMAPDDAETMLIKAFKKIGLPVKGPVLRQAICKRAN